MTITLHPARRAVAAAAACVVATAGLVTYGLTAGVASAAPAEEKTFTFALKPSAGITACLPHAHGQAWITPGALNDTMKVTLSGMPAGSNFDLFVIQTPAKPFGISWYRPAGRPRSRRLGS